MDIKRKIAFAAAVALCMACSYTVISADQSVSFGWDLSPSPEIAGYALYIGTASGVYDSRVDVGASTNATLGNLTGGHTYFFAVVAYNVDRDESDPSNEVVIDVPRVILVDEQTPLTLTNSAAALGLLPGGATFSLSNAPAGAAIDPTNGVFTWTPGEAQGPSTNVFAIAVTTNGSPDLADSQTITVIVNEINRPPILPFQPDRTLVGAAMQVVTNTAVDPDLPANTMTYRLVNPPEGAVIDASGIVTWTPGAGRLPGTNIITTIATDDNPWALYQEHLSATNSFNVIVVEPVVHIGGTLTLNWNATAGQVYQVQYISDLNRTNWNNLGSLIAATNGLVTAFEVIGPEPQRFYRIILVP
jgi:hypothetical protein